MNRSHALLVRRVIAILLMALTVALLFWPSFFGTKMEYEYSGGTEAYVKEIPFSEMRSIMTEEMEDSFEYFGESTDHTLTALLSVFVNVAFFGLIALAGVAIVLMLFNRSKAATVLHTVLAILTVLVFIAYFVYYFIEYAEEMKSYGAKLSIYPGVSAILIPVFSLAASILYKRDKSDRGAFQPRTAQQPVFALAGVPQQPVTRAASVPQQPAEWICASCNAKNDPAEPFCPYCGTKNPAPVIKAPEDVPLFCTNCGAKQHPGASFCPHCGAKLI